MRKLLLTFLLMASLSFGATAAKAATDQSWEQSLANLKQGNQRYLDGISKHPRIDPARRLRTATEGQKPIASILSCSDARMPVETVFDKAFGDLFVVRVAGNVCAMAELATLEYGVLYLHTPLVVVMGHTQCGAVDAALNGSAELKGSLPLLVKEIQPAKSVEDNVRRQVGNVLNSPGIKKAVDEKRVAVVGAVCDIKTGKVTWLK
jgi:carbonic anhydrase